MFVLTWGVDNVWADAKEGTTDQRGFRNVRWLGRGDAGVAAITDGTSAFYNPAGLGMNSSFAFSLASQISGNQNVYTTSSKLLTLTGGSDPLSEKFAPFLGKPLSFSGNFFPHFSGPGFTGGFFTDAVADLQYRNPVSPEMQINAINSYGLVAGSGVKLGGRVAVGAALRYEKRQQVKEVFDATSLLTISGRTLDSLMLKGDGYGLNVGLVARQPLSTTQDLRLAVATRDVGYTRFRTTNRKKVPERQRQSTTVGLSYLFQNPTLDASAHLDFVDVEHTDESTTKRLRMGIELSLLAIDLRAGLHQGYWTAGASLRLIPLLDVNLSTFGEELDSVAGIRENRVWMLGVGFLLDYKKKTVRRQRFTLDNL
jgi:hypothetical protein